MRGLFKKIFCKNSPTEVPVEDMERPMNELMNGFHGDRYLIELVNFLLADCKYFVETGTDVASTLNYVARANPTVKCLSCEPHKATYEEALKNTAGCDNVKIYNTKSQEFIEIIKNDYKEILESITLFWLDAHGQGFTWPIKEEISFITSDCKSGYILIDDFKVPGLDCFGYDSYKGQQCSFDYIRKSLNQEIDYALYYPSYTEKTSDFHPLRGWGLIPYGQMASIKLPEKFSSTIFKAI